MFCIKSKPQLFFISVEALIIRKERHVPDEEDGHHGRVIFHYPENSL
jgi:hypothetical protein